MLINFGICLVYYFKVKYIGLIECGDILLRNYVKLMIFIFD